MAASLTGIVLFVIDAYIHRVEHWYDLAIFGLLSFGLFFGLLVLFKEFSGKDLNRILEIANVKKMWAYIISDLRGH